MFSLIVDEEDGANRAGRKVENSQPSNGKLCDKTTNSSVGKTEQKQSFGYLNIAPNPAEEPRSWVTETSHRSEEFRIQDNTSGGPSKEDGAKPSRPVNPYYDVDFYVPERKQRIPGKFLLPPEAVFPPGVEEKEEEEEVQPREQIEGDPVDEVLPGMGTREFKR